MWCLRRLGEGEVAVDGKPTFVAAMCDLVQEGGDADTNGAVAGALMGCFLCVLVRCMLYCMLQCMLE